MTRVTSQALNKSYGKERRKRCVFRRLRKTRNDADVTWRGTSFKCNSVWRTRCLLILILSSHSLWVTLVDTTQQHLAKKNSENVQVLVCVPLQWWSDSKPEGYNSFATTSHRKTACWPASRWPWWRRTRSAFSVWSANSFRWVHVCGWRLTG